MTLEPRSDAPARIVTLPEARREVILDALRQARRQITLSLFRCNDKGIFAELAAAVGRGVDVEVLVTSRAKGGKKKQRKLWRRLEATGARLHAYSDPVVKYHAKYLVVDDGPAIVASLNLTKKCFSRTCDVVVLTWSPEIVTGLRALLAADCEASALPAGITEALVIGPERARRQLTALIESARSSIQIIDAKLSDPGIVTLLNERRAAGIAVDIHDDRQIGNLKSHGKVMLIDDRIAVVGSLALAALSLDFRREVAIVVCDPDAVEAIRQLFQSIGTAPRGDVSAHAASQGGPSC
jgi:phosphatidylserine/phosphatidylglycerophosphate/cardiolipin synthase-like enzyme